MKKPKEEMSLVGHLKELRNRVIISILALVVGFLVVFQFAPKILKHLISLGTVYGYRFVYLSPQELFLQYMKLGLIGAICIASPILLYQIAMFVSPGLKKKESIAMLFSMTFGLIFFLIGVYFAYRVTIPFMLNFFYSVNISSKIKASISIANYISMLITVFLVFGAVFELPVVSVVLTWLGLLKAEWMVKGRSLAIVAIFLLAAIITPPDIVSQCLVAGPMILLYQLSIFLCKIVQKVR